MNDPKRPAASASELDPRRAQRGQILVIFAGSMIMFMMLMALVVDVGWYWSNGLKMQRAADAAALAGAIYLPGDYVSANKAALAVASMNGYVPDSATSITTSVDANNPRQLDVTINGKVSTFFLRVIGVNTLNASRSSDAVYVVPVPMGSPQSYYGVYHLNCSSGVAGCSGNGANAYNTINATSNGNATADLNGSALAANANGNPNTGCNPVDQGSNCVTQGFFGAVITSGGSTENGDMINPTNDLLNGVANPLHNAEGYDYTVVIPSAGGKVQVFDPTFCGVQNSPSAMGEGDHWIVGSGVPVNTYYRLYNTNNTPLILSDDTLVASSGYLFTNENQTDQSGIYGTPQSSTVTNCATGKIASPNSGGYWHNKWWTLGSSVPAGAALNQSPGVASNLPAGTYRLEVTTTDPSSPTPASNNANVNAENMFSIQVAGGGAGLVYGSGSMANWYNISSGSSTFYLAQIGSTYAGKTLQINLFDVGDNGSDTWLGFKSPDGPSQKDIGFSYTSASLSGVAGPSGTVGGGQRLQTTICNPGCSIPFQDMVLTISIPLPSDYGSDGLWQNGWWQVKYDVASGNDTTTWQVNVLGNPVHLLVP